MSIDINIENYEAFLLDLAEGNLSFAEEKALIQFLAKHPELEVDLEELPVLEADGISLQKGFKSNLLREESTGLAEKDFLMISSVEGELNTEEKKRLGEILRSDETAQNDLAYYHKTKLPIEEVAYSNKGLLIKKERNVVPLWTTVSSIAAAILLLIYFGLPQDSTYVPRAFSYQVEQSQEEETSFAFAVEEENASEANEKQSKNSDYTIPQSESSLADNSAGQRPEEEKNRVVEDRSPKQLELMPTDQKDLAEVDSKVPEMDPIKNDETISVNDLAEATDQPNLVDEQSDEKEVLSPLEYARKLIKEDVLKNRSLKESVKDEVANLTNKKVNFDQEDHETEAQFALNIGKLKIRKK